MNRVRFHEHRAFTLLEVSLAIGLLILLSAMAMPAFLRRIERERLPESARRMRSLITLVRANAAFDGKRYRVRFPGEEDNEEDLLIDDRQPIIERENEPIDEPEVFDLVTAPWAIGTTLLDDVWCAEVRLGRPTIETIRDARERRSEIEDALEEAFEDVDPERPPLYVEPDGTSDWATFVLTNAPRESDLTELEDEPRIEVIVEGATGLAWLQRPFYDEEIDLFEEHNWPAVMRRDFLDPKMLTEDDVLELTPFPIQTEP